MTASLYSIAKACLLQSRYKRNDTNNKLIKKLSYITNSESRISIQEEINFVTNLFTSLNFIRLLRVSNV